MYSYIWDFDGTLFDTYESMEKALREAFTLNQKNPPKDLLFLMLETSVREVIALFGGSKKERITADYHRLEKMYQKNPQPFFGAEKVLAQIVKDGGQNFLFTHRDRSAGEILANHHLETYFNAIITSEENFKRKPDPEGIQYLLKTYHLNQGKTWMIGDRQLDIAFGKNGGVKTIWFNAYQQPLNVKADFEIQSLQEILAIGG